MSGTLRFYGASDDLVEVEGDVREEYNPGYETGRWEGVVTDASGHRLLVVVTYAQSGTWAVGIAPVEEGLALPENWTYDFALLDSDYSVTLTIDGPEAFIVEQVYPEVSS